MRNLRGLEIRSILVLEDDGVLFRDPVAIEGTIGSKYFLCQINVHILSLVIPNLPATEVIASFRCRIG